MLNFVPVNSICKTCSISEDTVALYIMRLEILIPSIGL